MAQSQISSNTTEDSSQERSENESGGNYSGKHRRSWERIGMGDIPTGNASRNAGNGVPSASEVAAVSPLHNLAPFVYDEDGTTPLDWWCLECGCDYSFGQEQVIQGEVIASAESQAVPRNEEIALPPQNNSTNRTEKCAGSGKVRKTSIQVPILPRLAPNKSRGPKA